MQRTQAVSGLLLMSGVDLKSYMIQPLKKYTWTSKVPKIMAFMLETRGIRAIVWGTLEVQLGLA